jgi:hypothetical protein
MDLGGGTGEEECGRLKVEGSADNVALLPDASRSVLFVVHTHSLTLITTH